MLTSVIAVNNIIIDENLTFFKTLKLVSIYVCVYVFHQLYIVSSSKWLAFVLLGDYNKKQNLSLITKK